MVKDEVEFWCELMIYKVEMYICNVCWLIDECVGLVVVFYLFDIGIFCGDLFFMVWCG